MPRTRSPLFFIAAAFSAAGLALANPVDGDYFDGPDCDNHGPLQAFEELGTSALFPADEFISAAATFTSLSACTTTDDPTQANVLLSITNLTGRDWTNLFYVGDPETRFSNVDGFATTNEAPPPGSILTQAFRIDEAGMNQNLVFESGLFDGIFAAGETWQFIIQDYDNLFGIAADQLNSLDFAGGSFGDQFSSGSIVAFEIPAPGATALFGLAGLTAAGRRRG